MIKPVDKVQSKSSRLVDSRIQEMPTIMKTQHWKRSK